MVLLFLMLSVSCTGEVFRGSHGVFGTGRPPYGNNENCGWYIVVPPQKVRHSHIYCSVATLALHILPTLYVKQTGSYSKI